MFTGEEPCTKSQVAPARERGLKYRLQSQATAEDPVAPERERGLKCRARHGAGCAPGRSREGAWIEIRTEICCY